MVTVTVKVSLKLKKWGKAMQGYRFVVFVFAIGLFVGSCGSFAIGHYKNREGDGIEPAQTFTASLLGIQRGSYCYFHESLDDGNYWSCNVFASYLSSSGYSGESLKEKRPIATFVAKWMLMPVEWLLSLILFGIALYRKPQQPPP